jgi:thioredoxin reductase
MILEKDVVVVGAGPAGLAAAIEAAKAGAAVLLVDLNLKAGGQLFKQIHKFFGSRAHYSGTRGYDIGKKLVKEATESQVEIWLQSTAVGVFPGNKVSIERILQNGGKKLYTVHGKTIILATGASENVVRFKGWTRPGVMGAGAAQTMVNVDHVKPGQKIVMLGSGNVGLIVSYQLMQAGCDVVALVEAAPKIGGYAVHAAKIRRAGVPIFTKHTIVEALGDAEGKVSGAVIAEVDEKFQPIPGTEQTIPCDTITLAAGLKPVVELTRLMNCASAFEPVLGGFIPMHNQDMETSVQGIFVAGDATGVEEASVALEEGRIAGVAAAQALGLLSQEDAESQKQFYWNRVNSLRSGPFGEKRLAAKQDVLQCYQEQIHTPQPEVMIGGLASGAD